MEAERNIIGVENNAKISFENYMVNRIILRNLEENEEKDKFGINISTDESNGFLKLNIKVLTKDRYIELEMIGIFKFDKNFIEKDKDKFLRINGTAILYPYIRAYISTITSFDKVGSPAILPTINFQKFYDDYLKEIEKESQEPK